MGEGCGGAASPVQCDRMSGLCAWPPSNVWPVAWLKGGGPVVQLLHRPPGLHHPPTLHPPPATMMQAAFGKGALAFSSLAMYALLGFGALGGPLALPFGLYVLVCQRKSEGWIQDEVSGVSGARQALALGITLLALTVLLPESAGVLLGGLGAGGPAPDLF